MTTKIKTAAIETASIAYVRDAAADAKLAVSGGIAARSGAARMLMIAHAAKAGGANGADSVDTKHVKAGLKALGYKADDSDCEVGKNEFARARAWFYVVGSPDDAETLAPLNNAAWDRIGKQLICLEKARDEAEAEDPKAEIKHVTLDGAIALAKAQLVKAAKDAEAKGDEGRMRQDDHRAAKALGAIGAARLKALDPARPVAPAESEEPKKRPVAVVNTPAKDDVQDDAQDDAPKGPDNAGSATHYTPQRDHLATLMVDLLRALDAEASRQAGGIKLPISAGARADDITARINAARKVFLKGK